MTPPAPEQITETPPGTVGTTTVKPSATKAMSQPEEQPQLQQDAVVAELERLLSSVVPLALEYVADCRREDQLVVEYHPPAELESLMDLALEADGCGPDGITETIKEALKYSVRCWNPRFMDKLYATTNPIGVVTELVMGVLNANSHVYHVSPAFTIIEIAVVRALGGFIGFPEDMRGGLCTPSGSMSNLLAVITARNAHFPEIKRNGFWDYATTAVTANGHPPQKPVMFTSEQSHYSFDKSAFVSGIGLDNVLSVPCDEYGRMIPAKLREMIQASRARGERPFFVNATAGTTVLGAFDPLREIGQIAREEGLWFHVDGSWGGPMIFSSDRRHLLDGAELADSFTINPHKMLGVPVMCSFLLSRDRAMFNRHNALHADYLFHDGANPYDLGDGTLGCGRRPESVKMFMAWKYYGTNGLTKHVDLLRTHALFLDSQIRIRSPRLLKVLDIEPELLNVCFWYVPASLRHIAASSISTNSNGTQPLQFDDESWVKGVEAATKQIHGIIRKSGKFMFDYAPLHGKQNVPPFFRLITHQPALTEKDLIALLDEIERVGADLDAKGAFHVSGNSSQPNGCAC
ncbi:PLP-dependent transferase [Ramicandelaber brevisporus]|nr:PLP-dependent transferase [Ramicandelaber brevisporus]